MSHCNKMEVDSNTCETLSTENEDDCDFSQNDTGDLDGNPKLADALNKVLRMTKKTTGGKSIVLSKAKLYDSHKLKIKKPKYSFEIEPHPESEVPIRKDEEEDVKPDKENKKIKTIGFTKHERLKRGRVKPDILDREKERLLSKIATRGVVQLFNAVRQHQSALGKKLNSGKLTEAKKEKVFKSLDRKAFLNALSGSIISSSNVKIDVKSRETEVKNYCEGMEHLDLAIEYNSDGNKIEEKLDDNIEETKWEVLRDDFMMGAKLKDWDKKEDGDEMISNDEVKKKSIKLFGQLDLWNSLTPGGFIKNWNYFFGRHIAHILEINTLKKL